jgi:Protein of unknown function (DUF3040)
MGRVERWARRLDRIEQQLAAEDPELVYVFALWDERCSQDARARAGEVPEWVGPLLGVLGCLAVLAVVVALFDTAAAW